jgi:hypothetical protein
MALDANLRRGGRSIHALRCGAAALGGCGTVIFVDSLRVILAGLPSVKSRSSSLHSENFPLPGNAGGFFYVDSTLHLDTKLQQLCSGRTECPLAQTKIRLTQFTFAADGHITGEVDLLPANSVAQAICSPLGSVFTPLP